MLTLGIVIGLVVVAILNFYAKNKKPQSIMMLGIEITIIGVGALVLREFFIAVGISMIITGSFVTIFGFAKS